MGFAIMVFSALIGIVLTILGITKQKGDKKYLFLCCLGVALIAFAVYLGWPK